MKMLIVGGDNMKVLNILNDNNKIDIDHISGRKPGHRKCTNLLKYEKIFILTQYCSHVVMSVVKRSKRRVNINYVKYPKEIIEIIKDM